MNAPRVHLNGTSRAALLTQTGEAVDALRAAYEALRDAEPHGRDYYPISPTAYADARAAHQARVLMVDRVYQEMRTIHLSLVEVPRG